jgi:hypothetical protein
MMKTIKTYLILLSLPILLLEACGSMKNNKGESYDPGSLWQKQPLEIDGSDSDWIKPLPYFDKKEKISYGISNDREHIYLMISTKDPLEQQKILEGGLIVWVNSQALKTENSAIGIAFPTGTRNDRERNIMTEAQPERYKDRKPTLDDVKDYSLYGFKKGDSIDRYPLGERNAEGIELGLDFNSAGDLIYEASIPLHDVFPMKGPNSFIGKSIALGIFVEGIPPSPGSRRSGGGSPVSVGTGIGLGMGSFGGGGGIGISIGGGSFNRMGGKSDRQIYDPAKIWCEVELARPR